MPLETRKIHISHELEVSSQWAIPENYRPGLDIALVLAHGAGNGMEHPFLSQVHLALAESGLLAVKFNFPYMELGRKAPDRTPLLEETWRAVIRAVRSDTQLAPSQLYIGGKSMGGRMASHVAAQGEAIDGLVFLGYPLHPAGQPSKPRIDHWSTINCPSLFIQGTRDSLCQIDSLRAELPRLGGPTTLHEVTGGDHSFKLPKSAGISETQVRLEIVASILAWIGKLA